MALSRILWLGLAIAAAGRAEVTFYKDVLPILQDKCLPCHRPGEAAPMWFQTYAQTRPWAKAIKQAVLSKKMPPWSADPRFGKFSNDPTLAPDQIHAFAAWVDGGSREGKRSDAPPAREFAEGWRIPKPDVIFELPREIQVPAAGVIDYMFISVPTGFTEDRWVEMAELRPTTRSVVHHAIVYTQSEDRWPGAGYLAGYAPGAVPQMWRPGEARLIKAGTNLLFQMHYTPNGKPSTDRTQLGLVFAKKPPERQIIAMSALNHWFEIPAGEPDYHVEAARTLNQSVLLMGLRPHMHLRGKAFEFRAVFPDGRSDVLLRVPRYDFEWQPYYYLETPLALPKGTRIECTAEFDNSPNNANNPNPRATVGWGDQSWDEMMIGWFDVAVPVRRR
jgi:hypothetical protein